MSFFGSNMYTKYSVYEKKNVFYILRNSGIGYASDKSPKNSIIYNFCMTNLHSGFSILIVYMKQIRHTKSDMDNL